MRALLMRMVGLESWMNRIEARVKAYEDRLLRVEQSLRELRGS
jgi:hypothetical protein